MGVRLDEHSMDCWMIYSRYDTSRASALYKTTRPRATTPTVLAHAL